MPISFSRTISFKTHVLVKMMTRRNATIAQHITTIQEREYVIKDANMRFNPTKLGIALVEGYNSIGYQLNKPDLRRETEAECNNVAFGRKTKDQIMVLLLAKMKQCYEVTTQEAEKLIKPLHVISIDLALVTILRK
jgi:DNA topoisomerase IA